MDFQSISTYVDNPIFTSNIQDIADYFTAKDLEILSHDIKTLNYLITCIYTIIASYQTKLKNITYDTTSKILLYVLFFLNKRRGELDNEKQLNIMTSIKTNLK